MDSEGRGPLLLLTFMFWQLTVWGELWGPYMHTLGPNSRGAICLGSSGRSLLGGGVVGVEGNLKSHGLSRGLFGHIWQ